MAARDHQVAVIQRRRLDANQDLRRQRFGLGAIAAAQAIDGLASGDEFIGAHRMSSYKIRPLC